MVRENDTVYTWFGRMLGGIKVERVEAIPESKLNQSLIDFFSDVKTIPNSRTIEKRPVRQRLASIKE